MVQAVLSAQGGPLRPVPPATPDARRPAVFLDRDGVLNVDAGWLARPEDLEPIPGAMAAVARLEGGDYRRCVVTNQSVVARGLCDEATLGAIHAKLIALLAAAGATLDGLYYCPHYPGNSALPAYRGVCTCRKPAPGMLLRAAAELNLDLARSWVVGDSSTDMALARTPETRGLGGILVRTGHAGREGKSTAQPHFVVDDITAAVDFILDVWPRLDALLAARTAGLRPGDTVLIAGAARQGKTTLAQALALHLTRQGRDAQVVSLDNWVLPVEERGPGVLGRYELAAAEAAVRALVTTRQPLTPPRYDAYTQTRHPGGETLRPTADTILIIEGVPALVSPTLCALGTLRWFIEGDEGARRRRFFAEYRRRGWDDDTIDDTFKQRLRDELPLVQASAHHADSLIRLDEILQG